MKTGHPTSAGGRLCPPLRAAAHARGLRIVARAAAFSLLAFLAGAACSGGSFETDRFEDATQGNADPYRVLQVIPADESVYPRQEFPLLATSVTNYTSYFRLKPAVLLAGKVMDKRGNPVHARLRFHGAVGERYEPTSLRRAEVDGDALDGGAPARYKVGLVPGDYVVDLLPFGGELPSQRQALRVQPGLEVDFVLSDGVFYTGRVTDAAGRAVTDATVRAVSLAGELISNAVAVDADGRYKVALGPSRSDTFRLEFSGSTAGLLPRVQFGGLAADQDRVLDIQYLPVTITTVSGQVVDHAGLPAASVDVVFAARDGGEVKVARRSDTMAANTEAQVTYRTRTGHDGRFSLRVPRGAWEYALTLQSPIDRTYGGLTIVPYGFTSGTDLFSLPSRKPVAGAITDDEGYPLANAEVVLARSLTYREQQQLLRVFTDRDGRFEALLDTSVSSYDVTVLPADGVHARCVRNGVTLESFTETFIVPQGVVVDGFVTDENGRGMERVSIRVVESGAGGIPRLLGETLVPTDPSGNFRIVIPEGESGRGCR